MSQLGNCESLLRNSEKPWNRGRRGDFSKHAKKMNLTNREAWDWSLSNCELARIHGMSPQAVRKTRISLGKPAYQQPSKPTKVYGPWKNGPKAPKRITMDLGVGLSNFGKKPRDWQERFWEKVEKRGVDECWPWTGTKCDRGYGQMFVGTAGKTRRPYRASRLSYLIAHGEVPEGYVVRHKCDNPPCCNPNHLEIGIPVQNSRDAVERQQLNQGTRNGNAKFIDDQIRQMRSLKNQGYGNAEIAKLMNTSSGTVCSITNGRAWRNVK